MQHGEDSGTQTDVTCCVGFSHDAATRQAIIDWAVQRGWTCHVESSPYLAWATLLLAEKSHLERTRWGLQSPGRAVLLIDERAADESLLPRLTGAVARYLPSVTYIVFQEGTLPSTVPKQEPPTEESVDAGPNAAALPDDEEEDANLTPEEIEMLLGDDTMETVS